MIQGLFPAHYFSGADALGARLLDGLHSHFIFVDGTDEQVIEFRKALFNYFGSRPIEFDATRTRCKVVEHIQLCRKNNNLCKLM